MASTESIVHTYSPREVNIVFTSTGSQSPASHIVHGYAEDSFVSITFASEGITKRVGCDGEVVRSILPDETFQLSLNVLQTSATSRWLTNRFWKDRQEGNGMFSVTITDNYGGFIFSCPRCWVSKLADHGFGREAQSRQWTIMTSAADAEYDESTMFDYSEYSAQEKARYGMSSFSE